jgi:hypothetical protein
MSESKREYAANYRKPPEHTRFKKIQSGNPRGRPAKNLPALLAAALNEKVTVTENGKRRQITKREAVIAQLVNKSAAAELRATEMLIDRLAASKRRRSRQRRQNPRSVRPTKRLCSCAATCATVVRGPRDGVNSTADPMAATRRPRSKRHLQHDHVRNPQYERV